MKKIRERERSKKTKNKKKIQGTEWKFFMYHHQMLTNFKIKMLLQLIKCVIISKFYTALAVAPTAINP